MNVDVNVFYVERGLALRRKGLERCAARGVCERVSPTRSLSATSSHPIHLLCS